MMKLSHKNKYFKLFILLFYTISLALPGTCLGLDSEAHQNLNVKQFLDTASVFKNDSELDITDDVDEEFNLNSRDKVRLNLDVNLNKKDEIKFKDEFKNATSVDGNKTIKFESGPLENTELKDSAKEGDIAVHRRGGKSVPLGSYTKRLDLNDIIIIDPKNPDYNNDDFGLEDDGEFTVEDSTDTDHLDEDYLENRKFPKTRTLGKKDEVGNVGLEKFVNGVNRSMKMVANKVEDTDEDDEGSRRVLKLNLEPEGRKQSGEKDSEAELFKNKILHLISTIRKLKSEVIQKNTEIDNLFTEVGEMRLKVSKLNNIAYTALFKDLENLSKDLNLLRKGNIYTAYADNILGNITVMEAFHGLCVIYRTPFVVLRHNSKLYAKFEKFVINLFKYRIPHETVTLLFKLKRYFKNVMNCGYGNTLKIARSTYIYHSVTRRTGRVYDLVLTDYLKYKFEVDVTSYNSEEKGGLGSRLGQFLTRVKVVKHYKYLRHSLFNNHTISSSFLNRNHVPGMHSNTDFLYVKQKDYRMLEVLYHVYRLKLLGVGQRTALMVLRYLALFFDFFAKDPENAINSYTKPLLTLREDSLFRFKNIYVLLRSASIYALQKVELFMDYCFNYANRLNPELSILVPRDLSNRIFFVSVVILATFLLIFIAQLLLQALFSFVSSLFSKRSKASVHSRLRHWYHRSHVRQVIHILKRQFASQGKSHKKKHRYHRNFEGFHRIIDDGTVTTSDNYRLFKPAQKAVDTRHL